MARELLVEGDSQFIRVSIPLIVAVVLACAAPIAPREVRAQTGERSGEEIVRAQCFKCHEAGIGGAPKIGDRAAWAPRLKNGLDNTVRSAVKGHGGMPARGGMANLTDSELRSAIVYMFSKGAAPAK